ncbi:transmembrane protease serine 9-like [Centruroides sculpturatus]|uniref:transmembrane protease serine 9-like n=1 Tax=Centruroides sculpturatus TaxID=218467 RepID=UPI000C6CDF82|nr:transmembrane protease serine 9-like [Centruroides sculpturatus]
MNRQQKIILHLVYSIVISISMQNICECCQRPQAPSNGRVWFRIQGGLTAIYTCNVGYVLKGTNVSQCQTDGQWSSPPPKCHLPASLCSSPELVLENLHLPARSAMVIDCDAGQRKNISRTWLKDGALINEINTPGITILANLSILVHSGSPQNQGIYLCLVQTSTSVKIGKALRLLVDNAEHSELSKYHGKCNLKFKDSAKVVYGSEGNSIFLRCGIDDQSTIVEWFKGDKLLRYKDNYQHLPEGTLYVENLKRSDAGAYMCVARSSPICNVSRIIEVKLISQNIPETFTCGRTYGKHRVKRIIDGARAENNTHPWMCMLSTQKIAVVCGCSLISDKWAVTAAHCFSDERVKRYFVKLGKRQRGQVEKEEIVTPVVEVVVHPLYQKRITDDQGNQVSNENDIALLKLETPVRFKHNILPICLPAKNFMDRLPPYTMGVVTGWGRVSLKGSVMAVTLQEASLPIISNKLCIQSSSYVITENMFCAGYAESYKPDTCYGDSGGPLTVHHEGKWYLVGIISWGEGCSTPRKYGIYTKVENYVEWIQNVTGKST